MLVFKIMLVAFVPTALSSEPVEAGLADGRKQAAFGDVLARFQNKPIPEEGCGSGGADTPSEGFTSTTNTVVEGLRAKFDPKAPQRKTLSSGERWEAAHGGPSQKKDAHDNRSRTDSVSSESSSSVSSGYVLGRVLSTGGVSEASEKSTKVGGVRRGIAPGVAEHLSEKVRAHASHMDGKQREEQIKTVGFC